MVAHSNVPPRMACLQDFHKNQALGNGIIRIRKQLLLEIIFPLHDEEIGSRKKPELLTQVQYFIFQDADFGVQNKTIRCASRVWV